MNTNGTLFFALMYKNEKILEETITSLKNDYGKIISKSLEYDFNFTDYYEKEFGDDLKKIIVFFNKKINNEELKNIKLRIKDIEREFFTNNKRKINIDPGYMNHKEVVLASFKGKNFKEDIGQGVYAHKVLEFDNGELKSFFHTFPDFKSGLVQDFFLTLIKQYL